MMKTNNIRRRCVIAIFSFVFIISVFMSTLMNAAAAMENVYTENNPDFEMAHIYSSKNSEAWLSDGTIEKNNSSSYTLKTNSWAFWLAYDGLDFAYNRVAFNTGKGSTLTVEMTVNSWNGTGSGSTGILIRNSLDAGSTGVYLCIRDSTMYFMYRKNEATEVNRGITVTYPNIYPIQLKIVCDKSRNNASGYYKTGDKWVNIGNVPFKSNNYVYSGVSAHSVDKKVYSVCTFSDYSVMLDAPEGYTVEDDVSSGDDISSGSSSEDVISIPEDAPPYGDALLTETFTDGNLFPDEESQSVTNPLWTVRSGIPNVVLNEAQTDRSLYMNSLDDPLFMTAGDMNWTDYSTSVDIFYPSNEIQTNEINNFTLLVRHCDVLIGGSFDYGVTLINKFKGGNELVGQYLQLNYRRDSSTYVPYSFHKTLKEVCLVEGGMVDADVTHNLRVDTFDNNIKVYFDGELLIDYTDEQVYPNLMGSVGIYSTSNTALVDNIVVRKLTDTLGGDYDNQIGGSFDLPIPDYIKEHYGRE